MQLTSSKGAARIIPVSAIQPDPIDVLKTSLSLNLSTYYWEYVVLAQMRKLRLVTADQKILASVPDIAVSIHDFATGK
jgi:predicted nucleic acid-binding protein